MTHREDGWEYRFTSSEPALSVHVAEYEKLGFEVRLVRVTRVDAPAEHCSSCVEETPVFAVYVRRRGTDHSP